MFSNQTDSKSLRKSSATKVANCIKSGFELYRGAASRVWQSRRAGRTQCWDKQAFKLRFDRRNIQQAPTARCAEPGEQPALGDNTTHLRVWRIWQPCRSRGTNWCRCFPIFSSWMACKYLYWIITCLNIFQASCALYLHSPNWGNTQSSKVVFL